MGMGMGMGMERLAQAALHTVVVCPARSAPALSDFKYKNRCFQTERQSSHRKQQVFTCSGRVRMPHGKPGVIPHPMHMGKGFRCSRYVWVE